MVNFIRRSWRNIMSLGGLHLETDSLQVDKRGTFYRYQSHSGKYQVWL